MSAAKLQGLLRFLSQDAKVPLATAMAKVKDLQSVDLDTPEALAKVKPGDIASIFSDEKVAKRIISSAKRITKTRATGDDHATTPRKKRKESLISEEYAKSPAEQEEALELPVSSLDEDQLAPTVLFTNRAPLVLAFVVTLLKYTMPEQPVSSRLSLAQAYVSVTSRSRAVDLGIESGKSAEDEGLGEGQPFVTILGKDIRVLRRWGYDWARTDDVKAEPTAEENGGGEGNGEIPTAAEANVQESTQAAEAEQPALWAIDLEALKKANHHQSQRTIQHTHSNLPIFTPQSARAYLLKTSQIPPDADGGPSKKLSAAARAAQTEENLGKLLRALDMVYDSWAGVASPKDLDRRTWGWYVKVRPSVADGVAGWGGKNVIRLADILALRRAPDQST